MSGAPKFKMDHVILTTPLSGMICHPQSWTAMFHLTITFEVSISTRYDYMKVDAKCRNSGDFWYLGVTQGHWK